ncbi:alpha-amylase family glycosyl hydrolase [Devosia sp. A8/3-2]|nr:alpha-amylase family glycosyl hydrolase [Devosia sp. A8/3-2]
MIDPPEQGGHGMDAMVSDDFQHAVRVAATGHNDFYYRDYLGTPQELVSALKYGFLYQGQRSDMRDKAYGTYNLATPPEHFVHFLENHDRVANSARGFRLSSLMSPARLRAITSLLLLGPQTPCLFRGQEFGASNPFLYFFGVSGDDARVVAEGRRKSLTNFPGVADPVMQERLPDPDDPATFEASKLDWAEAERHAGIAALHRDLLRIRREDPAFSQASERRIDGAVIGEAALLIRYVTPDPGGHRLLLLNLGRDLQIGVVAEPLLAPADGHRWRMDWSSEHPDYDGAGRRPTDPEKFWILPSDCAPGVAQRAPTMIPPRATYRLQLNKDFTFADATALVPYLDDLGVSHAYLSPILKARPGSTHGYDTVDHSQLNPELGSLDDFRGLAQTLQQRGMGIILDFVPNHMGVGGADNALWLDVLKHAQASRYADWFDIDWHSPRPGMEGKLLVPFLGTSYAESLAAGHLRLKPDGDGFAVWAHDGDKLPIRPEDASALLQRYGSAGAVITTHTGQVGQAGSWSALDSLITKQNWRLVHFSTAADEINYRRFFVNSDWRAFASSALTCSRISMR